MNTELPVATVLPALAAALNDPGVALLQAPPGAGKTTVVPLALLDAPWRRDRILLLEPRRLAARAAARRMATMLGERVGSTVGISTRVERKVGPGTRIEVVTEGILTRRLQRDPALEDTGLVIFDEFHERSLQADLGLALCLQARELLRPDLRLLVMSATLETGGITRLLPAAPVIRTEGRSHPVHIDHRPPAPAPARAADATAVAVKRALATLPGSILVFLPGRREIDRATHGLEALAGSGIRVTPLHGQMPPEAQDEAIRPAPEGTRKVVLATDIAETSLTIEGIAVVIDSGLARRPRFDPRRGLSRLETVRISRASAAQRCGRAGRLGPGVCIRLWSKSDEQRLPAHASPEILEADLAPLALTLACWGADADELAWLDPPPAPALAQARDLLQQLGALDDTGTVTVHGRAMDALGTHPRVAHMLLTANERGLGYEAALLAALLEERDPLDRALAGSDIRARLRALTATDASMSSAARRRLRTQAARWAKQLQCREPAQLDPEVAGALLALAYPDRVALRRPGPEGRFLLASGRGAFFPREDDLAQAPCIVAAVLDAGQREALIHLAAPLDRSALAFLLPGLVRSEEHVEWDADAGAVNARVEQRLGALVLESRPLDGVAPEVAARMLLDAVAARGPESLPWTPESRRLRARMAFARAQDGDAWPDVSDEGLRRILHTWLAPWVTGMGRMSHLRTLDLGAALRALLDWPQQQRLDRIAPTHLTVPSGSRVAIDYGDPGNPVLAVRIQEVFGWSDTPRIGNDSVPLTLHLLSPARRPVQVTRDLAGFWARTYAEVKKDLKGRYPKHAWPDDPLNARALRGTKRARQ
ncbi:ATP-dependent helicase HrpB [Thioalkalivibrio nitratireducens DSM 14787]|uniref:ATP-dependent helicase HrpB n=1 Tax=Thioalkalivibrio nitratireducens (strain DSM 14787 / UNIQEM 213 / ALEN2) TaxID=1255043 RepID=L0DXA5_THIND|nr:ATP-dependent helicase HrpB [Thioalkalivibrio nitratireducens]AGA33637.1 ATP-dependent helicase HrpB [Thioalkalivibrio nitratireducens DSM 14787]